MLVPVLKKERKNLLLMVGGSVAKTSVQQLAEYGQSVWLDYISRSLIDTGRLKNLIDDGVCGLTSNPSIFDKAVSNSKDYDHYIQALKENHKTTFEIYDDITVRDVQDAADLFLPVYKETEGLDGYVSLEINPKLAHDVEPTITEGRRLYEKVNRTNIMFKVPSTEAGFPAITALLANGINVNVTLIFSLQQYVSTTKAYLHGLEKLLESGGDLHTVRSVASVFVSRVDTLVDQMIDKRLEAEADNAQRQELEKLKGMAAVANSAIIYDKYVATFSCDRFRHLAEKGANIQRLLWGSTSTKNPAYSDIKYVTELIGKNTVNTIPQVTLEAFLDHGIAKEALPGDLSKVLEKIDRLRQIGIDINDVCKRLLDDGVAAFQRSFDSLLQAIQEKARKLSK
jgi:transaldolase